MDVPGHAGVRKEITYLIKPSTSAGIGNLTRIGAVTGSIAGIITGAKANAGVVAGAHTGGFAGIRLGWLLTGRAEVCAQPNGWLHPAPSPTGNYQTVVNWWLSSKNDPHARLVQVRHGLFVERQPLLELLHDKLLLF